MSKKVLFFLVFFFSMNLLFSQMRGADLSYNHSNSGKYKITLKLYYLNTIGKINQTQVLDIFSKEFNTIYPSQDLQLDTIIRNSLSIHCVDKTDSIFCIIYSKEIELNTLQGGFLLNWNSCCVNEHLSNIEYSNKVGFNLNTIISKSDNGDGNSSPVFTEMPVLKLCLNQLALINVRANDVDKDSLVYELQTPFRYEGSSQFIDNSNFSENGNSLPKLKPTFKKYICKKGLSEVQPFGPNCSGFEKEGHLLKIIPNTPGNYMLGIVVKEFRNMKLIGTNQRIIIVSVL